MVFMTVPCIASTQTSIWWPPESGSSEVHRRIYSQSVVAAHWKQHHMNLSTKMFYPASPWIPYPWNPKRWIGSVPESLFHALGPGWKEQPADHRIIGSRSPLCRPRSGFFRPDFCRFRSSSFSHRSNTCAWPLASDHQDWALAVYLLRLWGGGGVRLISGKGVLVISRMTQGWPMRRNSQIPSRLSSNGTSGRVHGPVH